MFEREYPGASWLASRALRELEVVGGKAEALVSGVALRYGLSVLDRMLPDVQQTAKAVMGKFDDKALHSLLDTLAAIGASIDDVPEDLPPPAPRRTPARLRRSEAL